MNFAIKEVSKKHIKTQYFVFSRATIESNKMKAHTQVVIAFIFFVILVILNFKNSAFILRIFFNKLIFKNFSSTIFPEL